MIQINIFMKLLLPFFFLFVSIASCFGQEELQKEYHVYLNDGSYLKGKLIAADEEGIQLLLFDNETVTIKHESIKRMKKRKQGVKTIDGGYTVPEKGNYNMIAIGLLAGRSAGNFEQDLIGLSAFSYIRGVQKNQFIGFGGGMSIDIYESTYLPLYLDFRGYMNISKLSFFYGLNAGYAFAADQVFKTDENVDYKGGVMVHPSIGLRLATHYNYGFILEAGYRFQYAERKYDWNENADEIIFKRLALRVGMTF